MQITHIQHEVRSSLTTHAGVDVGIPKTLCLPGSGSGKWYAYDSALLDKVDRHLERCADDMSVNITVRAWRPYSLGYDRPEGKVDHNVEQVPEDAINNFGGVPGIRGRVTGEEPSAVEDDAQLVHVLDAEKTLKVVFCAA